MSPVAVTELRDFCIGALQSVGMNDADAAVTADSLVLTDSMGVFTHGTKLLIGYIRRLRGGGYRAAGRPQIQRQGAAWVVVDGDSALGQIGCHFTLRDVMTRARQAGVAYGGLVNTGHIGAAGVYAALAAREGLVAMITGNDMPSVAVPGSRKAVLGSNPIALAFPVEGRDPIVLDIATAAVAGGKVYAAHQRGEPIPPTWLIGPDGHPTTDGSLYPHQAALAPMAGHKGYGFGLWAEVLSALLPGGAMTWQVGSWIFDELSRPSLHNAGFLAIDVKSIAPPGQYASRMQALIDEIHSAPTADGVTRVLLPGEREWELRRMALESGIPLPADVRAKLDEVAAETGQRSIFR